VDVSVSAVESFQRDQLDWYYEYVRGRVPRRPLAALEAGTSFHALMEAVFRGKDLSLAIVESIDSVIERQIGMELDGYPAEARDYRNTMDAIHSMAGDWKLNYPPDEVLAVEEPLTFNLGGGHRLIGRPDTIVRYQGKLWDLQHKTIGDRVPIGVYVTVMRRNLHGLAYSRLIQDSYPRDAYGGTYLNGLRKLSRTAFQKKPEAAFVQQLIPLMPKDEVDAIQDIRAIVQQMQAIVDEKVKPIQNRKSDSGIYGNTFSPYFFVKLGEQDIADDTIFKHAVNRYPTLMEAGHDEPGSSASTSAASPQ